MDEVQLAKFSTRCRNLKHKLKGIYPADKFPLSLPQNSFMIINTSRSNSIGTHWILICNRDEVYIFADPLGQKIEFYPNVYNRMQKMNLKFRQILTEPLQPYFSNFCGFYCLYIANAIFSSHYPMIPHISENSLLRFVNHMT